MWLINRWIDIIIGFQVEKMIDVNKVNKGE